LVEDLVDLLGFVVGAGDDLGLLALEFGGVVLGVSARGEISSKSHGDRSRGDFGEAGEHDDVGAGDRSGESGGEGEGDGEAVGEADDYIADGLAGFKVALDMGVAVGVRVGGMGNVVHGGSLR
jgi:hypothetical protein